MNSLTHDISASELVGTENQIDRYYYYGDLDGLLGNQPNKELWQTNSDYKQGYLDGFARRIDNQLGGLDVGEAHEAIGNWQLADAGASRLRYAKAADSSPRSKPTANSQQPTAKSKRRLSKRIAKKVAA